MCVNRAKPSTSYGFVFCLRATTARGGGIVPLLWKQVWVVRRILLDRRRRRDRKWMFVFRQLRCANALKGNLYCHGNTPDSKLGLKLRRNGVRLTLGFNPRGDNSTAPSLCDLVLQMVWSVFLTALIEASYVRTPQISCGAIPLLGLEGQSLLTPLLLKGLRVCCKLVEERASSQPLHGPTLLRNPSGLSEWQPL